MGAGAHWRAIRNVSDALIHPGEIRWRRLFHMFLEFDMFSLPSRKRALSMRYADAGVNISVADEAKRRIAAMAGKTFRRGVLAPIGGFGSLFQLDRKRWRDPILVSSADGVGTKLKVAFATGIHSTVGADILNHCVNDILTQGAEPLFFLDYLAMGKMDARHRGAGDRRNEPRGETSRLRFDRRRNSGDARFLSAGRIRSGGLYRGRGGTKKAARSAGACGRAMRSLRCPRAACTPTVIPWRENWCSASRSSRPNAYVAEIGNKIGAELLKPHRPYWPLLKKILARGWVSSMAHITGGGITGNLAARAAAKCSGRGGAGLVARAADFSGIWRSSGKSSETNCCRLSISAWG